MKENNHLGNTLEAARDKAKYNSHVKNILASKIILAWILKYSVKELKERTVDEIVSCIEGKPEIGTVPMYPGLTNTEAIVGMPTEDEVQNEGKITYDIRFYVRIPDEEKIKIIVNVEAQKKYNVEYNLVTRAIFYCARMLSAQLNTEFTIASDDPEKYDNIKKVYSIWICMDSPRYAENTITEYHITQNNIYGNMEKKHRYDLMSAVMICLSGDNSDSGEEVHKMLSVLLSSELGIGEKNKILADDYNIHMSKEMEREVSEMCNLADVIEEKGIEKGADRLAELINILLEDGRIDDVAKVSADKKFRETLYKEFEIK